MNKAIKKNQRKAQVRNYWAYHNRRKILQPNGGYEIVCYCGKAVEICPDCSGISDSNTETSNLFNSTE